MTQQTDLADVLSDLEAGSAERESAAGRPHDVVDRLRGTGFLTLRVPRDHGGADASLRQVFEALIDVARADSNVAQALRAHFAYVEGLRFSPGGFEAVTGGSVIGNAITEPSGAAAGDFAGLSTVFVQGPDGWTITGTKFYSTGTLYADRVWVWGVTDAGVPASALIPLDRPGITVVDDWDGFGQRASGSGTTHFENTPATLDEVVVAGSEPPPRLAIGAFLQLWLTAVIVGNLEAASNDAQALLRGRSRGITHGTTELPRHDPVLLQQAGDIASKAYAARAIVLDAASLLDDVDARLHAGDLDGVAAQEAGRRVAEAKISVERLALDAATELFEVGGASATRAGANLDRHWRNIRTLASHNSTRIKARVIGDHVINGSDLPDNTYF
ncbi:alkylation response protein AidB-like acyl-CoA dehydrogenase [Actinoplanes lutulentus]|uniref:Alkylation response protein AidB-like acyl-CoA dehydrogenase n=1 Tax=Actinoplanes lutulentus TaxID=1287878 RepID=A0A327YXZ5_9ACTN|nr:acyl-CoA dehydrogenase family protein [Actinoplanes lutulentus]MBB2946539.1 alkylation response protein AidB-like acyl-CoA dehydrogenase [Actinoplanes lutulentus]RAK26457.1 alkylation response protein AidB-like acyl-CoA dehydrogenase [Actinoplanes lutulentus]